MFEPSRAAETQRSLGERPEGGRDTFSVSSSLLLDNNIQSSPCSAGF